MINETVGTAVILDNVTSIVFSVKMKMHKHSGKNGSLLEIDILLADTCI